MLNNTYKYFTMGFISHEDYKSIEKTYGFDGVYDA